LSSVEMLPKQNQLTMQNQAGGVHKFHVFQRGQSKLFLQTASNHKESNIWSSSSNHLLVIFITDEKNNWGHLLNDMSWL